MTLTMSIEPYDALAIALADGSQQATVSARPSSAAARSLLHALEAALRDGYGDCFWPGDPGGQYWWIFKRDAESLEVIAMWTRGGASLWEHVFRATDAADWVRERLTGELERLGIATEQK